MAKIELTAELFVYCQNVIKHSVHTETIKVYKNGAIHREIIAKRMPFFDAYILNAVPRECKFKPHLIVESLTAIFDNLKDTNERIIIRKH